MSSLIRPNLCLLRRVRPSGKQLQCSWLAFFGPWKEATFFWTFFQRTKRLDCNAAARNKSSRLFIGRPFLHHLPCLVLNHLEVCKKVPQKQLEEKDTSILLMTYAPHHATWLLCTSTRLQTETQLCFLILNICSFSVSFTRESSHWMKGTDVGTNIYMTPGSFWEKAVICQGNRTKLSLESLLFLNTQ